VFAPDHQPSGLVKEEKSTDSILIGGVRQITTHREQTSHGDRERGLWRRGPEV